MRSQNSELNSPTVHSATRGPDAGISYAASTNSVQKVLDRLKAGRKKTDQGSDGIPGDSGGASTLSRRLDDLIEFSKIRVSAHRVPPMGPIEGSGFPKTKTALGIGAIGIGGAAVGLGTYHIVDKIRRQREWHRSAGDRDVLKVANDLYVDKHGAMYPKGHPGMKNKKVTELSVKLDDLIEFGYNKNVIESAWRRMKKPSTKSVNKIYHDSRVAKRLQRPLSKMEKVPVLGRLSARLDNLINFQDPRPRNPLGEFSPQGDQGPNPNSMATVYKQPQERKGIGVLGGSALSVLGGLGGAAGADAYRNIKDKLKEHAKTLSKRIKK